jgi:hypothetical protein
MNNIRNQRMLPKHKAGQKNAFNKVGYPSPKYAFEDWAWAIEGVIQLPRNVYYAYNVPSVGFEHRLYVNGRDGEGTADAIERFAAAHAGTEFRLVDISVDGRQVVGTTILLVEIGERALPSRPRATGAVQVDRLRLGDKTAELDQQ